MSPIDPNQIKFVQDSDLAIKVLHAAGSWLRDLGKNPSKWWQPENLNREFLLKYAEPEEFFVGLIKEKPATAAIFQKSERNQSWETIDKGHKKRALYVHWLAVHPDFSGRGLPKLMLNFASEYAKENRLGLIRLDTNAEEPKLRKIYEDLSFTLKGIHQIGGNKTAFYEKKLT